MNLLRSALAASTLLTLTIGCGGSGSAVAPVDAGGADATQRGDAPVTDAPTAVDAGRDAAVVDGGSTLDAPATEAAAAGDAGSGEAGAGAGDAATPDAAGDGATTDAAKDAATPDAAGDATPDVADAAGDTGTTACTNSADQASVTAVGMPALSMDVFSCLQQTGGTEPATTTCIASATTLSAPCVACFDAEGQCGLQHCLTPCNAGLTTTCTTCLHTQCTPAFNACSGLTGP